MLIITGVENQPEDFRLLAQNMQNYDVCGYTEQEGYAEVTDIPSGFEQRVLPPQYGIYLNLQQINTGLLLENRELSKQRSDIDFIAVMTDIDLGV
jgi:hypothetical protein